MATANIGRMPNNALFHGEANLLMRAAEANGGSLTGRYIEMRVDRELCRNCDEILPYVTRELGYPTVHITDGTGAVWVIRDGAWLVRGRP